VEATPIRNGQEEITAVMEMSTDVTQIKRLQEQLRASQGRYRLLFEEVPCYISIQSPDLRIIEANRAFREDFGDVLGKKCYEVYKHRTEECVPCSVQQTLADGELHVHEEVVTSLRGEKINVLVTTAPIRDASGEIVSVMEMSANITQVRQLESQLTSLGLLIGSVSHGLKGLLNGLAGGMYLVDTGFKKDNRKRIDQGWEIVGRNVDRIRSMVSDILYYAKERTPNWEPVDAAEIAAEVLKLAESRAKEHNVALRSKIEPGTGSFEADALAVRAMLVNLLENSVDACRLDKKESDHEVALALRGSPQTVEFTIADNGIGMDRETQDKAFTLFFSSKGSGGTGLGLFIANRIATAHGGTIELNSEPGVGTNLTVKLPRKRPEGKEDVIPSPESEASHG
jgi:PAS domain S-box-containing protein